MRQILMTCLALLLPGAAFAADSPLIGTWKIQTYTREIIATGARGRGPGWKRPSRRPSGPGKMTDGMNWVTCG